MITSSGVVRRIDELGRLVIPKEIRKDFKWNVNDSISFKVEDNYIVIKKHEDNSGYINRKIDANGRVVIPKESRSNFDIKTSDQVEFFSDSETKSVYIRKYIKTYKCIACNSIEGVYTFKNIRLCKKCIEDIKKL